MPATKPAKLLEPVKTKTKKEKPKRVMKLSTIRLPHHSPDIMRMFTAGVPAVLIRLSLALSIRRLSTPGTVQKTTFVRVVLSLHDVFPSKACQIDSNLDAPLSPPLSFPVAWLGIAPRTALV